MIIERTKSKNNNAIFIFRFRDMDEKDFVIDKWKECVKDACDEFEWYNPERLKRVISSLENRIDGKYGTDEYKLSGILFEGEFLVFANETSLLMCAFKDLFDKSKKDC